MLVCSYINDGGVAVIELSASILRQAGWDEQLLIEYMLEEEQEDGEEETENR